MRARSITAVLAAVPLLISATAAAAMADDISNSLDQSVGSTMEIMPLTVGGASASTQMYVVPTGGDGKPGCNLTRSTTLTVAVTSSAPTVTTVSPSSVTFTSCGDTETVTVTPVSQGSATISLKQTSNDTGGSFDLSPATFTVNVTPPPNNPPSVAVAGVTPGATYQKGTVLSPTCEVTDAEDGTKSFAATLSAITGTYSADGIGQQTASCSYTDSGGLTAESSVTYSIVDRTAPAVTYTLDPATPNGDNDWYRSDVSLTWHVSEPDSPSSLVKTGCADQTITFDQKATQYSCSATSLGGTADPVTVTIKRDATAPQVAYSSATGTLGANDWYTSDVTATFTATDATSGPATASQVVTSSGEGAAVEVDSPVFKDLAGNAADVVSHTFKIDKTAPTDITFQGMADGAGYYYGSVPAQPTCTATDDVSGLAGCVVTGDADPTAVGDHTYTATATNNAGLSDTAELHYTVLAWTLKGFYAPVDMNGTWNTVKGGSTVPLKFEVFAGDKELTDTSVVQSFTQKQVACPGGAAITDAIEVTTTGGTSLRYDTTAGQFVQNWQTPKKPGACYAVRMTTVDGTHLDASFALK